MNASVCHVPWINACVPTHLVCPANQVQVVLLQEVRHAVRPKCVAHTAVVLTPALQPRAKELLLKYHTQALHCCTALDVMLEAAMPELLSRAAKVDIRSLARPKKVCFFHTHGHLLLLLLFLSLGYQLPGTSKSRTRTWMSLSGSAHSRSQSRPLSGTSVGRATRLICSRDLSSGDRPPCMHRI